MLSPSLQSNTLGIPRSQVGNTTPTTANPRFYWLRSVQWDPECRKTPISPRQSIQEQFLMAAAWHCIAKMPRANNGTTSIPLGQCLDTPTEKETIHQTLPISPKTALNLEPTTLSNPSTCMTNVPLPPVSALSFVR